MDHDDGSESLRALEDGNSALEVHYEIIRHLNRCSPGLRRLLTPELHTLQRCCVDDELFPPVFPSFISDISVCLHLSGTHLHSDLLWH